MPKPYLKEFRDDVVRVARNREPGHKLKQIAADFGISESCLAGWIKQADVEDGIQPGTTSEQSAEFDAFSPGQYPPHAACEASDGLRSAAMPTCEGDANVRARSLTPTG
ncbi:transposase [Nocardia sp. KC 131]|uniref:transposase n=1 Tax=Nocardia arseniciresistens TaxID=3392119 RepID=UPI00398E532E